MGNFSKISEESFTRTCSREMPRKFFKASHENWRTWENSSLLLPGYNRGLYTHSEYNRGLNTHSEYKRGLYTHSEYNRGLYTHSEYNRGLYSYSEYNRGLYTLVNMIKPGTLTVKKHIQSYTMKMGKTQKNRIFLLRFPHTFNKLTHINYCLFWK